MGSVGSPNNWAPYDANYRECSHGICSIYCPQWCSMVFPPPPPFFPKEDDDDSKTNFSPLIIAIIGILASTVLLVIYYILISKYRRRRRDHQNRINQLRSDQTQMDHHDRQWQVPSTGGLDEGLIKSIAVCKYKKGDGLVEGTECVVCLSEFQEDESLRLLPKCSHAFHLPCIDTWLKSHSNCPLCRASVVSGNSQSSSSTVNVSSLEVQRREDDLVFVVDGGREREGEVVVSFGGDEIGDSGAGSPSARRFRRSISVDSFSRQVDEDPRAEIRRLPPGIGSSVEIWGDDKRSNDGNGLFHLVRSPVAGVKRSVSTERFKITKSEKGKNSTIPI